MNALLDVEVEGFGAGGIRFGAVGEGLDQLGAEVYGCAGGEDVFGARGGRVGANGGGCGLGLAHDSRVEVCEEEGGCFRREVVICECACANDGVAKSGSLCAAHG